MKTTDLLLSFGIFFISFALSAYLRSSVRSKQRDPLIESLLAALPAWDCGLCGQDSCRSFARSLAASTAEGRCVPGGESVEKKLSAVLGREPYRRTFGKSVAIVACAGDKDRVKPVYDYIGYKDCAAVARLYGGPRACGSGCLGYGSCVSVCPRRAISVRNGLAVIDAERCDGCGICLPSCPTGVIRILPRRNAWYVACSSTADPKVKQDSCSACCTACGICERRSAGSEFSIKSNLALASSVEAGDWAAIADDCPTGVIRSPGGEKKPSGPFETDEGGL